MDIHIDKKIAGLLVLVFAMGCFVGAAVSFACRDVGGRRMGRDFPNNRAGQYMMQGKYQNQGQINQLPGVLPSFDDTQGPVPDINAPINQ